MARTSIDRDNAKERVREFLLSKLRGTTQERYRAAQRVFEDWCNEVQEREFAYLNEEDVDFVVAEALLDLESEGATVANLGDLLSSISKRYPVRKFRTAWKVFEEIKKSHPAEQAPALPEMGAYAIVVILCMWSKHACAGAILICFCGAMRINEVLRLRIADVVLPLRPNMPRAVVLLLGATERGTEERVVLTHPAVVWFMVMYYHVFCSKRGEQERFFVVSYTTVAKWLWRASYLIGLGYLNLRTHSCRRGGATALLLHGLDLPTIALFGRWASERSCRLYLRRGEVMAIRLRSQVPEEYWNLMNRLNSQFYFVFSF